MGVSCIAGNSLMSGVQYLHPNVFSCFQNWVDMPPVKRINRINTRLLKNLNYGATAIHAIHFCFP